MNTSVKKKFIIPFRIVLIMLSLHLWIAYSFRLDEASEKKLKKKNDFFGIFSIQNKQESNAGRFLIRIQKKDGEISSLKSIKNILKSTTIDTPNLESLNLEEAEIKNVTENGKTKS